MKQFVSIAVIAGCLGGALGAANYNIGISGSDQGIDGFSLSIGNYYKVPRQEVMVIERSVPRDEMSVVYYLASKSHRDARFITDLRLSGTSWWDISLRLGLDPHTLYVVDSRRHSGPPYGEAYGYSKDKNHRLGDAEIVDLVNVRFLSEYHHISPDEVIERRRGGEDYNRINEHYRGKKDRGDDRDSNGDKDKRGDREKGHKNPHER